MSWKCANAQNLEFGNMVSNKMSICKSFQIKWESTLIDDFVLSSKQTSQWLWYLFYDTTESLRGLLKIEWLASQ